MEAAEKLWFSLLIKMFSDLLVKRCGRPSNADFSQTRVHITRMVLNLDRNLLFRDKTVQDKMLEEYYKAIHNWLNEMDNFLQQNKKFKLVNGFYYFTDYRPKDPQGHCILALKFLGP